MHLSHLLIQAIAWLSRFLTFIQSNIKNARTRKSILFVGFGSLFLLYGTSKYLLPAHRHFHKSHTARRPKTLSCLDPYLGKWNLAMKASDAVFKEIPESTKENRFFSFTGISFFLVFSLFCTLTYSYFVALGINHKVKDARFEGYINVLILGGYKRV